MYTPLYVKTNYFLLSSLIKIDDYIEYAKKNNYSSIAITDNNMFGVMEFYKKCINNNIKPIIGLELDINNSILLLYAKNYTGDQMLIKLATLKETRNLQIDDILAYHDQVIGIIPYKYLLPGAAILLILLLIAWTVSYAVKAARSEAKKSR